MGWLARKYGLQANSVTAIELVTADGRPARVDARARARPLLGPSRRERQLRRRHGDRVRRLRGRGPLRGRDVLPVRPGRRGPPRLERARPHAAGRADDVGLAPAVPGRAGRARAGARRLVRGGLRCLPRGRGRRPRPPASRAGPGPGHGHLRHGAARGSRNHGDGPARSPALHQRHRAAGRPAEPPASTTSWPRSGRGPGRRSRWWSCACLGGALERPTPAAGARATLPGAFSLLALGVPEDEASAATVTTYLDSVERAVLPYRSGLLPELRRRAGRRERLLRPGHLGPPAPRQGAPRPRRPVQGQPPHPARRPELS